jgi:NAD(P)-dependent dehydrogenase (short-subunit alcohol dehydrogenase family)
MKLPLVRHRNAFVTGCSTGIGRATAQVLREAGWTVTPTARRDEDLDSLRADGFRPAFLDLLREETWTPALDAARAAWNGEPAGALINNAGYGQPGALEDLSPDQLRRQLEVNVVGLQALTNRFLPEFRREGCGRIVHVSSVVGRLALPFLGIYSASKFAVEALADAQRVELTGSGIGLSLIEPGPIATHFGDNALDQLDEVRAEDSRFLAQYGIQSRRLRDKRERDPFSLPPEAVASRILHAIESARPRRRYAVTVTAHIGAFMSRFAPDALLDAAMRSRWERRMKEAGGE